MAVPVLKLNLAPPPTLWRQHHRIIGWGVLVAGALSLGAVLTLTAMAYIQAEEAGHRAVGLTEQAQKTAKKERDVQTRLQSIDVEKELPRWRLAERILQERSFPWSRLTAELERSLVQDVRLKSIQRTRDTSQKVELKIKGEARTRAAEEDFVNGLRKNTFFSQVILERESENQTGGLEFDYTLPANSTPPAYETLPKYGPVKAGSQPASPASQAITIPVKTASRNKPAPLKAPVVQSAPRSAVPPTARVFTPAPRPAVPPMRVVPTPVVQPQPEPTPPPAPPPVEIPEPQTQVPEAQVQPNPNEGAESQPVSPRPRGPRRGRNRAPVPENSDQQPVENPGEGQP